jgi:hypothetical protein
MAKRLLVLALTALLAGCGLVVSKAPIFPDKTAASDPGLEGLYTVRGASSGDVAVVTRNETHYTATFYSHRNSPDPKAKSYFQSGAADFQLVALDGGDYAVQSSCAIAFTGAGIFGSREADKPYQYAVLMAARPQRNFWLGVFPGGEGFEKYRERDHDTVDLSGVDAGAAMPMFREWRDGLLQAGGESVTPIVHVADQSWLTQAPDDPHPRSCREMADDARKEMAKHAKPGARIPPQ